MYFRRVIYLEIVNTDFVHVFMLFCQWGKDFNHCPPVIHILNDLVESIHDFLSVEFNTGVLLQFLLGGDIFEVLEIFLGFWVVNE